MRTALVSIALGLSAALSAFRPGLAEAAEIKLLCAVAMKPAINELVAGFERSTTHKVMITYATAGVLRDKIRSGEPFDAALLPTPFMDPLIAQHEIASNDVRVVARSLISVGARTGSPKPDISTVAAFKNTMLIAKSISYADPAKGGGSGIQVARILKSLGIADAMKPKTKLVPGPESVDLVAAGEVEFALVNTPIIVGKSGVQLIGPIPSELYDTKDFAFKIGVGASAQQGEAAQALIQYLTAPAASPVWKAKGVEPGAE